ncbi:hypothetical protein M8J75_009316 [Diaphorina citri]|nr:hypothetical protein M8J75_009316 [Diaphorina citri]
MKKNNATRRTKATPKRYKPSRIPVRKITFRPKDKTKIYSEKQIQNPDESSCLAPVVFGNNKDTSLEYMSFSNHANRHLFHAKHDEKNETVEDVLTNTDPNPVLHSNSPCIITHGMTCRSSRNLAPQKIIMPTMSSKDFYSYYINTISSKELYSCIYTDSEEASLGTVEYDGKSFGFSEKFGIGSRPEIKFNLSEDLFIFSIDPKIFQSSIVLQETINNSFHWSRNRTAGKIDHPKPTLHSMTVVRKNRVLTVRNDSVHVILDETCVETVLPGHEQTFTRKVPFLKDFIGNQNKKFNYHSPDNIITSHTNNFGISSHLQYDKITVTIGFSSYHHPWVTARNSAASETRDGSSWSDILLPTIFDLKLNKFRYGNRGFKYGMASAHKIPKTGVKSEKGKGSSSRQNFWMYGLILLVAFTVRGGAYYLSRAK